MVQVEDSMPENGIPEEPDRLQVAAEIALSYPELTAHQATDSSAGDEPIHLTPSPVGRIEPVEVPAKACPNCGNVIPVAARFCRYCGQLISIPVPVSSTPSAPPTPAPRTLVAQGQYNRPGSYIDRRLRPGEQILFRTRLHWSQLSDVFIAAILAIAIFAYYSYIAVQPASLVDASAPAGQMVIDLYPGGVWFFYLLAFIFGLVSLWLLVRYLASELAITNQRVLGRYGLLWSKPIDIALADISKVISRRFSLPNQGSITLACIPRKYYVFQHIPRPKEFRQQLEAVLPAVRPKLSKIKIWRRLLIFLSIVLVLAAVVFSLFYFTGGRELMLPVEPVTFNTISQYPDNRRVTLEGYLDLPNRVHCDEDCGVRLVDYADPEQSLPIFISVPQYGEALGLNQMERLPVRYDYDDFRVCRNDGVIVGDGAAVRLTGRICHTVETSKICLSGITLIEEGHPPSP